MEIFSGSIPGTWEALQKLFERYTRARIQAVYEAGYFGFSLHDHLESAGIDCVVTPPSLVMQEHGNHVKTDRRDCRKLAQLLARGLLRRVWVPTAEQRSERQVVRRRKQLIADRVRVQNRIKAELRFYGIQMPAPSGQWSQGYLKQLEELQMDDRWMQESFRGLLKEYRFLNELIRQQTALLGEMAETPAYAERVGILRSRRGIGLASAMEYLVDLQDMTRFRQGNQLAAYVGLTPSQYSSGERVILDSDLAKVYGIPTFRLNEAVKRNRDRFPDDFLSQLSRDEHDGLTSQTAMSNKGRGRRRTLPYAFTEHGAVMAANILNSERAVQMSIFVVRAFIKMGLTLATNAALMDKLNELEKRLTSRLDVHEKAIVYVLGELKKRMEPAQLPEPKKRPIGFRKEDQ